MVFSDQEEFEAFNEQQGLLLKGIETFEESVLPPASVDRFDGPLCGGVPNAPDAFPFPNGLDEPNLCVQSNNLGGNPTMPSPSVFGGLVAVSAGFIGATSDVVVAGWFVDSFDVIFSEPNPTALGCDTISFPNSGTVEIRVYDRNEILLVMGTAPVDPAGSNFFGVWCPQSIGRFNVFDPDDPGGGAEGADNIQMWLTPQGECGDDTCEPGETCENCPEDCGACPFCGDGEVNQPEEECDPPGFPSTCSNDQACLPGCTCGDDCGDGLCSGEEDECNCPQDCPGVCPECVFFFDQAEFEAFNEGQGQLMKGFEDFEESILPVFGVDAMDDPLCGGVPNLPDGFPFPNGLEEPNLCVQSNFDHLPEAPNPRGVNGLAAVSAGFFGVASDIVLPNFFVDSLDLLFTKSDHRAVGFETISASGGLTAQVRVYGEDNNLMAMEVVPLDEAAINFTGVWCNLPISRINIFDPANGAEGGDNIQMWVSGVDCGTCPTDVDGDGLTGAFDLAFLLGLWGPCAPGESCACLDADGDGLMGAADLAVLLGSWGPCE